MPSSGGFNNLCIKCNNTKGRGNLLVCNGDDCPIVVHEKCMGCPARSDDVGKFYCPYCLSRNAYVEFNKAREDAVLKKKMLSSFIDDDKIIDHSTKQKVVVSGNEKRKRKSPLGETNRNIQKENCTRQLDGDKEESARECRLASLSRGKDGSLLRGQNIVSGDIQGDTSKAVDSGHNLKLSGQPNTATGGDNLSREEETGQPFEVNDIARTVEEQVPRKANLMFHKEVENNQENDGLSSSTSVQEKPSERETEDLKSVEENESGGNNCDRTACRNDNNSISDIRLGVDGGGGTSNKLSKEHNRVLRKRIKVGSPCEPPSSNAECSVRSSPIMSKRPRKTEKTTSPSNINIPSEPLSSNVDGRSSPIKCRSPRWTRKNIGPDKVNSPCEPLSSNVNYSGKSSPVIRKSPRKIKQTNAPITVSQKILFPDGRRRRLLWTEEEEEMIKKGVEKFASAEDKNIPWRTILEFGRLTFHSSRMPGDLKDKWRNMVAKEKLSK